VEDGRNRCSEAGIGIEACEGLAGCQWSTENGTCVESAASEVMKRKCSLTVEAGRDCATQTGCPVALCVAWREATWLCGNMTVEARCEDLGESCTWSNSTCGVSVDTLMEAHNYTGTGEENAVPPPPFVALEATEETGDFDTRGDDESTASFADCADNGSNQTKCEERRGCQWTGELCVAPREKSDLCFVMAGLDEDKCGAMGAVGLSCSYARLAKRTSVGVSTLHGELELHMGGVDVGVLEGLTLGDYRNVADALGTALQSEVMLAGWRLGSQVDVFWTWEHESRRLQGSAPSIEIELEYTATVLSRVSRLDFYGMDPTRAQAGIQSALRGVFGMENAQVLKMEIEEPGQVGGEDDDDDADEDQDGSGGLALVLACVGGALVVTLIAFLVAWKLHCKGKPQPDAAKVLDDQDQVEASSPTDGKLPADGRSAAQDSAVNLPAAQQLVDKQSTAPDSVDSRPASQDPATVKATGVGAVVARCTSDWSTASGSAEIIQEA